MVNKKIITEITQIKVEGGNTEDYKKHFPTGLSQLANSSLNTRKRVEISFDEDSARENGDLLIINGGKHVVLNIENKKIDENNFGLTTDGELAMNQAEGDLQKINISSVINKLLASYDKMRNYNEVSRNDFDEAIKAVKELKKILRTGTRYDLKDLENFETNKGASTQDNNLSENTNNNKRKRDEDEVTNSSSDSKKARLDDNLKEEIDKKAQANAQQTETTLNNLLDSGTEGKTPDQLKDQLKGIEELSNKQFYQSKKSEVSQKEDELIELLGVEEYTKLMVKTIKTRLTQAGLKVSELDEKTQQKLTSLSEETNKSKAKEIKTEISQEVSKVIVGKKLKQLQAQVEKVKNGSLEEKEKVKKELLEFISSDDIFFQKEKSKIEAMMADLQSNSTRTTDSPNNFP
ncbi:3323_t:CDS:2 [Entrophospora sp. SA101]|nr:3323_t:CDS:2 [Entrophospora sp. SA101]